MKSGLQNARGPVRRMPLILATATVLFLLGGCSSSEAPGGDARAPAARKPAVEQSSDLELVSAVLIGTDTAPATVRFQLPERPAVGQIFQVRLQVMPTQDVDKLEVTFEPSAGLEVTDAAPYFHMAKTLAGEAGEHTVSLRATTEGVFELRATVLADAAQGSVSSLFSIPVIVSTQAVEQPKP